MNTWKYATYLSLLALSASCQKQAPKTEFQGWEEMRVIKSEPGDIAIGDYLNNKQDTLMLINRRQGRLDFFNYTTASERQESKKIRATNELPTAPEFNKSELPLTQPASSVIRLKYDGQNGLLVHASYPDKLIFFSQIDEKWTQKAEWKLIPDTFQGLPLIADQTPEGTRIYIAALGGIQSVLLKKNARVARIEPRDKSVKRNWWWQIDADGDGDLDIIEWVRGRMRLIERNADASLLPARELIDTAFSHAEIIDGDKGADFYLIPSKQKNLISRYRIEKSKELNPFGQRFTLPLNRQPGPHLTTMIANGKKILVEVAEKQPLFKTFTLTDKGWTAEKTFPAIRNIQAIVAPLGVKDTLLIQVKDSADLFISRWENGRFSFPVAWKPDAQKEASDKDSILTLRRTGKTIWWVKKSDEDLTLFTWDQNQTQPKAQVFEKLGKNTEKITWLGADRLLYRQKYKQETHYVRFVDGKLKTSEIKTLRNAKLSEFSFIQEQDQQITRLVDGTLMYLNDKLNPVDQVVLPGELKILSFIQLDANRAQALDSSGRTVHILEKDESGIFRSVSENEIAPTRALFVDPVFSTIALTDLSLSSVSPGHASELTVKEVFDKDLLELPDVKSPFVSDYRVMDVTGNGVNDLLVIDYPHKRLTLISKKDNTYEQVLSWEVFDDKKYPYSDGKPSQNSSSEPREILCGDFDQDGFRDLVMMCHDRIIYYLAKKESK